MRFDDKVKVMMAALGGTVTDSTHDDGKRIVTWNADCDREVSHIVLQHAHKLQVFVGGYLTVNTYSHTDKITISVQVSSDINCTDT